jgi:hypothetical protein
MQTTHRQVRKAVAETHPFIRFRVHVTRGYIGSLRFIKSEDDAESELIRRSLKAMIDEHGWDSRNDAVEPVIWLAYAPGDDDELDRIYEELSDDALDAALVSYWCRPSDRQIRDMEHRVRARLDDMTVEVYALGEMSPIRMPCRRRRAR